MIATLVTAALFAGPSPTAEHPIVVGDTRVSRGHLRHWGDIARRGGMDEDVVHDAVTGLVISHRWISGEAADRGVVVTRADVDAAYRRQRAQSFPDRRKYRRYLRDSGQTVRDIRFRVRMDLLSDKLRDVATQGAATPEEQQERLDAFVVAFREKWRARTKCRAPWVSEFDCGTLRLVPVPDHPVVVGDTWLSRGHLRHWADIAQRSQGVSRDQAREFALGRLVGARWLAGEARERWVVVTRAEVARVVRRDFGGRRAHDMSLDDLRLVVRSSLLQDRLLALAAGDDVTPAEWEAFAAGMRAKWRPRTACRRPWVSRDCGG